MADDLREYLAHAAASGPSSLPAPLPPPASLSTSATSGPAATPASVAPGTASDHRPLRIVPKGLRSFDGGDADFFLELLPGPRDRDGLPDSIRFWKSRIEKTEQGAGFAVGLIYGPSGCGKTSLVKAGLLPSLAQNVQVIYVESTTDDTEPRLLNALRKRFPLMPANLGIQEMLAALRRGQGLPAGKTVLLVLDQFEQWLHANSNQDNADLVQALRQCDGERLQCIVLVRDDFWLAVSRFMRDLEVELLQGRNMALVDLFDQRHAVKVLTAFGRAFGALPKRVKDLTVDQQAFLDQAVEGLSQDRKVICVRLALFSEMVKARPWTVATLKEVGGIAGVGLTFLEETFSARTAPPPHRLHQKAAQAVLRALLPETGSDIKGQMQAQEHLQAVSGYKGRSRDFAALVSILDTELRLITPADPEAWEGDNQGGKSGQVSAMETSSGSLSRFYQLTHDYLVPSLRDWLSRKEKESRRGRARIRLVERAAAWNAKPQTRHLPAWWEWLNIRLMTRKGEWTAAQGKMMAKATRFHVLRGTTITLILVLGFAAALVVRADIVEHRNKDRGAALVEKLLAADTARVADIIADMNGYRAWTDPLLSDQFAKADDDSRDKLHAGLGLVAVDSSKVDYLYTRLLTPTVAMAGIVHNLAPFKHELTPKLWAVLEESSPGQELHRLRAASALAEYDPTGLGWPKVQQAVALDLTRVPSFHLQSWMEALRPVRMKLVRPLAEIFLDPAAGKANTRWRPRSWPTSPRISRKCWRISSWTQTTRPFYPCFRSSKTTARLARPFLKENWQSKPRTRWPRKNWPSAKPTPRSPSCA